MQLLCCDNAVIVRMAEENIMKLLRHQWLLITMHSNEGENINYTKVSGNAENVFTYWTKIV